MGCDEPSHRSGTRPRARRGRADVSAPRRFAGYELLRRVAVGGMAEVFEARRLGAAYDAPTVAVKRLLPSAQEDPDLVEMFRAEARLVGCLRHPRLARLIEIGQAAGSDYIAYDFLAGVDLGAVLRVLVDRGEGLGDLGVAAVGVQVAGVLAYVHGARGTRGEELEIVHRDVSPQNLILAPDGALSLIDFGIARYAGRDIVTRGGIFKGKQSYMSPEQVRCEPLDARSDLFSLGIILYELAAGRRLFRAESMLETLERVESGTVPALTTEAPGVDEGLARWIMRCLERAPETRPGNAALLAEGLSATLGRLGGVEVPPTEHLRRATSERLPDLFSASPAGEPLGAYKASLHAAEFDGVETTDQKGDPDATKVFLG